MRRHIHRYDREISLGKEEDALLVSKCLAGDDGAFRKLVENYQRKVFTIAFGVLRNHDAAMDVTQDAFVKVHRHLPKFKGNSSFYTWLYRIVVNLCIDRKRRASRAAEVDYDDALRHDGNNSSGATTLASISIGQPGKELERKELRQKMHTALEKLSEDHRQILVLREVEGLSYEEISDILGLAKGTVMSRLFHARQNFKSALTRYLAQ
jgi:RNA polymerase sigma-70 factor (ECF subfamily)